MSSRRTSRAVASAVTSRTDLIESGIKARKSVSKLSTSLSQLELSLVTPLTEVLTETGAEEKTPHEDPNDTLIEQRVHQELVKEMRNKKLQQLKKQDRETTVAQKLQERRSMIRQHFDLIKRLLAVAPSFLQRVHCGFGDVMLCRQTGRFYLAICSGGYVALYLTNAANELDLSLIDFALIASESDAVITTVCECRGASAAKDRLAFFAGFDDGSGILFTLSLQQNNQDNPRLRVQIIAGERLHRSRVVACQYSSKKRMIATSAAGQGVSCWQLSLEANTATHFPLSEGLVMGVPRADSYALHAAGGARVALGDRVTAIAWDDAETELVLGFQTGEVVRMTLEDPTESFDDSASEDSAGIEAILLHRCQGMHHKHSVGVTTIATVRSSAHGPMVFVGCDDGSTRVLSINDGSQRWCLMHRPTDLLVRIQATEGQQDPSVMHVRVLQQGQYVITGHHTGRICFWGTESESVLGTAMLHGGGPPRSLHLEEVRGRLIAGHCNEISVWDLRPLIALVRTIPAGQATRLPAFSLEDGNSDVGNADAATPAGATATSASIAASAMVSSAGGASTRSSIQSNTTHQPDVGRKKAPSMRRVVFAASGTTRVSPSSSVSRIHRRAGDDPGNSSDSDGFEDQFVL